MFFFFFNDTATTEIYTLSLHDALPICQEVDAGDGGHHHLALRQAARCRSEEHTSNSSHQIISYAVFCLKKKKKACTVGTNDWTVAPASWMGIPDGNEPLQY